MLLRTLPLGILSLVIAGCARRPPPTQDLAPARPLTLGVDVHQHPTLSEAVPFFSGEPGDSARFFAAHPRQSLFNQVQPEALEAAGVRLVFTTLWAPPARAGRDAMDETLDQLAKLKAFAKRRPPFALASDVAGARELLAKDKLVGIVGLEGADAIRSVQDVDVLFAAGIRVIALVHFVDNHLGGAEADQFGPVAGLVMNGTEPGLTAQGRAALARMFELGILVDLAHASERTMNEALDLAEAARAPVLYSHAGGAVGYPRTLSDPIAQRIARGGGLIGVGLYWSELLKEVPEEDRFPGFVAGTCDEALAHWLHYARLVGPEHVVLGSDFSSMIMRGLPGGRCRDGIRNAFDLPVFFGALEAAGIPRAVLDQSGERVLQVLERLERQASPSARETALRTPVPPPAAYFDVPL